MAQMDLAGQMRETFGEQIGLKDLHDHTYPCENPFKKFELGKFFKKEDKKVKTDKFENFLNITIKLDSYKTVSVRTSDEILDFIGDIGGFIDAVFMIFSSFGAFFSSRFIMQSLA